MSAATDNKAPAVNRFGSCGAHDLFMNTFARSISDADRWHPDMVNADVWAVHTKNGPPAAVSLDIDSGPWSVHPDMSPTCARALAAALIKAADIVDQFTAHQAEEAELARFNADPINRIELPGGVVAFEPSDTQAVIADLVTTLKGGAA